MKDFSRHLDPSGSTVRIGFAGITAASTPFAVESGGLVTEALDEAAELIGGAMAAVRLLAQDNLAQREELAGLCLHSLQAGQALIESVLRSAREDS